MYKAVWRAALELYRKSPIQPPEVSWPGYSADAYKAYEDKVVVQDTTSKLPKGDQLNVEGRGYAEWWHKWRLVMLHKWGTDEFVAEANKPNPEQTTAADFEEIKEHAQEAAKASGNIYELLDVPQIKNMPDPVWLVEGMIVEQSLGFIFGRPNTFKSFIALDLALSISTALPTWWGYPINGTGAVIYISSEGHASLKFRIMAWEQHRKVCADQAPFFLLRQSLDFMKGEDIGKLLTTVEAAVARAGSPIAAIFVDTVSRVLPGAEENLQRDMTRFIQTCDQLRERFSTVVIGLHHVNTHDGFRGSSVIPGAGDFMIQVKRSEENDRAGSIFAEKIKDAQDKWEQGFLVSEVPCSTLGAHTSLVVNGSNRQESKPKSSWPDKETCRRVLRAIAEAWEGGKPWSSSPQSQERYAPRIMVIKFQIPASTGKEMIETWLINSVLAVETRSTHDNLKGLRVTGTID
jgi:AAA domain